MGVNLFQYKTPYSLRKYSPVYQCITSTKQFFLESLIYFSVVSWDIREKCSNFALES